jgi:Transposase.
MRHLRSLVEHRRALIDEGTALTNRLQALLKLYFPQALELLSKDLWRPMDCEFLQRWPSLQALRKARPATLEAFWKTHGSRSEKRLHERLDVLAGARALTEDIDTIAPLVLRVESLVRQLQVLAQSLDLVESRIQELAAAFEDYAFFRALPGGRLRLRSASACRLRRGSLPLDIGLRLAMLQRHRACHPPKWQHPLCRAPSALPKLPAAKLP